MNPAEYERMYALEDRYWWFVARRQAAARFLEDCAPPSEQPLRVLDAGCGTGALLDLLARRPQTEVTGLDFSPEALAYCRRRGHHRLVGADLKYLPFRSGEFDVVTALDVLEHVPDDGRAAEEIARVLRPGGILVASVPAYQFLWGPHDEALHHYRRYTAAQLRRVIEGTGLQTERLTHLLAALFPVAAIARLAARGRKANGAEAGLPRVPGVVNQVLIGLQGAELAVARQAPLPFGLSILTVARKPVPARAPLAAVEEGVPAAALRW